MELNINRKKLEKGMVGYFVKRSNFYPYDWKVEWGVVEENYPSEVCLQHYEPLNVRTINGIPVKDFKTPTEWQKLPKGWTYNTKLFEYGSDESLFPNNPRDYKLDKPEDILKAIEDGMLVRVQDQDAHCHYKTEITKEGWRIVCKHDINDYHPSYSSVMFNEVYPTYEEAQKVIEAEKAERERQANLSDYEWSVEQIDKILSRAVAFDYLSNEEMEELRKRILELENVEDVELRLCHGGVEWKYCKNKRWKKFEL